MGHALKKEFEWPPSDLMREASDVIREASRKVSRTIDDLTDKLSKDIGQEVKKEEADKASAAE